LRRERERRENMETILRGEDKCLKVSRQGPLDLVRLREVKILSEKGKERYRKWTLL
jgi:hypothetical protein